MIWLVCIYSLVCFSLHSPARGAEVCVGQNNGTESKTDMLKRSRSGILGCWWFPRGDSPPPSCLRLVFLPLSLGHCEHICFTQSCILFSSLLSSHAQTQRRRQQATPMSSQTKPKKTRAQLRAEKDEIAQGCLLVKHVGEAFHQLTSFGCPLELRDIRLNELLLDANIVGSRPSVHFHVLHLSVLVSSLPVPPSRSFYSLCDADWSRRDLLTSSSSPTNPPPHRDAHLRSRLHP
jgi:hypothetical protein